MKRLTCLLLLLGLAGGHALADEVYDFYFEKDAGGSKKAPVPPPQKIKASLDELEDVEDTHTSVTRYEEPVVKAPIRHKFLISTTYSYEKDPVGIIRGANLGFQWNPTELFGFGADMTVVLSDDSSPYGSTSASSYGLFSSASRFATGISLTPLRSDAGWFSINTGFMEFDTYDHIDYFGFARKRATGLYLGPSVGFLFSREFALVLQSRWVINAQDGGPTPFQMNAGFGVKF